MGLVNSSLLTLPRCYPPFPFFRRIFVVNDLRCNLLRAYGCGRSARHIPEADTADLPSCPCANLSLEERWCFPLGVHVKVKESAWYTNTKTGGKKSSTNMA